jgi:transposase
MVRLATQAKNRLHAVLHRYHQPPPEGNLFTAEQRAWWLNLPVSAVECTRIASDLDTLAFAEKQCEHLEQALIPLAAAEARLPLLIQLPGFSLITAMTVLAALGEIERFPDARHLVGYAGFGTAVHDSGMSSRHGGITKAGRRDLRAALVEAAHRAANTHPHWQAELARLEPRLGRNKAIVAIARKLLVSVWYVLSAQTADRFADPERVGRKFMQFTYRLGRANRPAGQSAAAYARGQLDRLSLGADLEKVSWGRTREIALPPSELGRQKA